MISATNTCFMPHLSISAIADNSSDTSSGLSTYPGDTTYPDDWQCECSGAIPTIITSSDEISPGGSITLHVDSGGLACPDYSWEVTGIGYTIDSESENDLETVTLTSARDMRHRL